ncbi:MAG: hypothetical protein AAGD38_07980 [Acidobacteriota bacterium]
MAVKGLVKNGVAALTVEEASDRDKREFLDKVHNGLRQADAGETVSHEEARQRLAKWLS